MLFHGICIHTSANEFNARAADSPMILVPPVLVLQYRLCRIRSHTPGSCSGFPVETTSDISPTTPTSNNNNNKMTVTEGQILTAEKIPAYLSERLNALKGVVDSVEGIRVEPIQGGNVNYAFCVILDDDTKIFVKQAPEFVAIFGPDGLPLTSMRMQREMDVYSEWKDILTGDASDMLPDIYYFDGVNMVVIMEFFDGFDLLDHMLVDPAGEYHPDIATRLGDFMGQVHAQTYNGVLPKERVDYLTEHFQNREMRDIQLEYVFTKCYKEATDEQRAGLELTPDFMNEIEMLRKQYDGKDETCPHVLTHGDLHPGSVMVNKEGLTKVIDPEFTVYGPPGLDVGSLLSGYCLGAIHQAWVGNPEVVARIVDGAKAVWDAYTHVLKSEGIDEKVVREIEIQTVGFTVAEVCRTAMEFAGGRKWLQFEDPEEKAASRKAALELVGTCMIARHTQGIQLLFDEMKAVAVKK
eukprot:Nitzschia sp. Nitz4//scaffold209_size42451//5293//6785//NITZ4_007354-RA/size42451-augustus-gene-0.1-mRNA-1//1//CDS//3329541688//2754//frame0